MYKAILFARDGDWVTDFSESSKEEVYARIYNMGSRWYFYPVVFLIKDHGNFTTDKQRIVDVPDDPIYAPFLGKQIRTVSHMIESLTDNEFAEFIGEY